MTRMRTPTISKLLILSIASVAWFCAASSVQAQAVDLAVSPPTAYMKVKQGSNATHTVVIENLSDQPLVVTPKIVDFTSDNKTGVPVLSQDTTFPYFDFDAKSLDPLNLPPKGKAQLTLKMSIPSGVPNQEFPMTVLFESKPNTDFSLTPGTAQVRGTIGSNLILLVSSESDVTNSVSISSFSTAPIVDSFRPITFTPVMSNTGYAGAAASGSAQIKNWRDVVIAEYELRPTVILGNSSRAMETTDAEGNFTTQFYYKPLILLGIYKISANITIQNTDQPIYITQTKTILALPLSVVVLLLLGPGLWWIYTHFIRTNKPY